MQHDLDTFEQHFTLRGRYPLDCREFAAEFVSSDGSGNTFMKRRLRFDSARTLDFYIQDKKPYAMHMGAVTVLPDRRALRELVIDLDVTDKRRYCACECAAAKPPRACARCWLFIRIGAYCMSRSLVFLFGGAALLGQHWYFSGNRGVHGYLTNLDFVWQFSEDERRDLVKGLSHSPSEGLSFMQQSLLKDVRSFYTTHLYPVHREALMQSGIDYEPSDMDVMQVCWPALDVEVSCKPQHLIRCPGTRNPKSGHYVQAVDTAQLLDFVPQHWTDMAQDV